MSESRLEMLVAMAGLLLGACAPAASGSFDSGSGEAAAAPEGTASAFPTLWRQDGVPTPFTPVSLRDYGPAPELTNTVWRNTPGNGPLALAGLRGNVVAIDFWTFG